LTPLQWLSVFGGRAPKRGIYSICAASPYRAAARERQINMRFLGHDQSHYVFGGEFCNPAQVARKVKLRMNVRDARHRFWQLAGVPFDA